MAIVLALIFVAGICTEKLGIFTIFGGFLLGLLFHRHHDFVEAWRRQIGQFVLVFFLPIFFTYTGLRTNVLGLDTVSDWTWCGAICSRAVVVKVVPVYIAARPAGLGSQQSSILGVLMNTRALMELIVLNIGFQLGFIPPGRLHHAGDHGGRHHDHDRAAAAGPAAARGLSRQVSGRGLMLVFRLSELAGYRQSKRGI